MRAPNPADSTQVIAFMEKLGATEIVYHKDKLSAGDEHLRRIAFHSPRYLPLNSQPIATLWDDTKTRKDLSYENWASTLNDNLSKDTSPAKKNESLDYNVFNILTKVVNILTGYGYRADETADIVTLYAECVRHWILDGYEEHAAELRRAHQILQLGLTPEQELDLARNNIDILELQTLLNAGKSYALVRDMFDPGFQPVAP